MKATVDAAVRYNQLDEGILSGEALGPFDQSIGLMLRERTARFPSRPIVQEKSPEGTYQPLTWDALFHRITNVGAHLLASGVEPGDRIAILSENRVDMLIHELAVMSIGALSVPIFAGYFPHQIEYIVNHSGAKRLAVSTLAQLMKLPKCQDISRLESIILFDYDPEEICFDSVRGIPVVSFATLLEPPGDIEIEAFAAAVDAVRSEDSCLIMYTSGTTGNPKGVELKHSNLLSQQQAIQQLWKIGPDDRFLSYLPWHHSFGGLFERFMALYSGACLSLDESGGKHVHVLLSNWEQVRPTVFFSVPSVYQRLAGEIKASEVVRKRVFHPELRFVFTAAAPLPHDVSTLFTNAGIPVLEGWGLTETSPCVTLTDPKRERVSGVVGWPIPGVRVKLAVDGEILVSGPNVMKQYYNADTENREAFTEDGWFRTGDLGMVTDGGLRILGRRDGVFKLSNAEKVFAVQIEMALVGGSDFIEQAVVVGSGRSYVTTLIYPDRYALEEWGKAYGISIAEEQDLGNISDIRRLFAHELQRINNEIAERYQRIRKFVIMSSPLTLEAGELTPTSKIVRHKVASNNEMLVDAMYTPSCPPPTKAIICLGDCY
ncbi:MAG: AMP-dependent synthetase/ligase [Rhodothermales bacterium]